ncbi:hypothetical protein [Puniceicoccus vermicola]|uniref:Uncharacterized protein n=1 Tax=Puniceicoccus vermicola TaxID=388746 RepID=A0A7X1E310_9BACT|nr:hypothetical protein [Puniceicoccus vermicola]MBC2600591.1 hypothetical protein [Puniceicoccus vermicola]
MKKNELRVWAIRTHSPDEWWVEVDGEVSESVVSLDEAFRRADGAKESFIIHSSHAEEADNPNWIKMGVDEPQNDSFGLPKWVCGKCSFPLEKPDQPKISVGEALGYILVVPGILMTRKRKSSSNGRCPHCGSDRLIAGNSKAGKVLLSR